MSIENDLTTYLLAQTALTDQIGTRLRPLEGQQGDAAPFLVYEILSRPRDQSQNGETGLAQMLCKLQCFGTAYDQVRAVEKALRRAFHSFQNRAMGDSWVQWAKLTDAQDTDQPPIFRDANGVWQGIFTLSVWYEEPAPAEC